MHKMRNPQSVQTNGPLREGDKNVYNDPNLWTSAKVVDEDKRASVNQNGSFRGRVDSDAESVETEIIYANWENGSFVDDRATPQPVKIKKYIASTVQPGNRYSGNTTANLTDDEEEERQQVNLVQVLKNVYLVHTTAGCLGCI